MGWRHGREGAKQLTTPVTTLDPRFSARNATATSWDETCQVIESAEIFWISTVRADGRPHVTPLVAVWLDEALHFCTGFAEQKTVNLRQNPHVILTTGCNDWDRGFDVVVEGDAARVTDHAKLTRLAEAWSRKWDGRFRFEVRDGGFFDDEVLPVFAVAPSKVVAFRRGTFGHTLYRFARP
jgi:nitroimidazol reductase NimA-like FMN-containing flavoprotein (pyridoxamine 5'-phosphate oxidase superfamily)